MDSGDSRTARHDTTEARSNSDSRQHPKTAIYRVTCTNLDWDSKRKMRPKRKTDMEGKGKAKKREGKSSFGVEAEVLK